MAANWSVQDFSTLEVVFCGVLLLTLAFRRRLKDSRILSLFVIGQLVIAELYTLIRQAIWHHWLVPVTAYRTYFYVYWLVFAIESCLGLGILFELYHQAMKPLPGLQRLGKLMFRWAGSIAMAIAVGMALGPHITSDRFIVKSVFQLQQTASILILCLLLFVTFAIRPMGLSFRSRVFGVGLGLGIMAAMDLVSSSWAPQASDLKAMVNLLSGLATLSAFSIWIVYFALPEQKRQLIVLPTTSPFLRWNQIALALGDSPGFVAPGGIDPAFLAPAEVEIMERASVKMVAKAHAGGSFLDRRRPELAARAN